MAVFQVMWRFQHESEQDQVERALSSDEDSSFLIDRLGAEAGVDQDLAVVLIDNHRPPAR